jgi:topoisomerase-4 subunit A
LKPPDGATFRAVLIGMPQERWLLASSAGYGFVVKLADLHSRNKAGKAVLSVPAGASVVPAAPVGPASAWIAAASSDGRLLLFPIADLPELARGRGNKILALPGGGEATLAAVCVLAKGDALKVHSGPRSMSLKATDLAHYRAARGRRGTVLPRGWRKVERLAPEPAR